MDGSKVQPWKLPGAERTLLIIIFCCYFLTVRRVGDEKVAFCCNKLKKPTGKKTSNFKNSFGEFAHHMAVYPSKDPT